MYYPIIDKLKEIMTDITSVKNKEPLVIVGTLTGQNSGTWAGNWNDIVSAFNINKPVYFTIELPGTKFLVPVESTHSNNVAKSGILFLNSTMFLGEIHSNNKFLLSPIQ